ncbi:hypothetical protein Ssi02_72180 [Sinosporangium siamense]|uniref:Uncharacterized protein n=1 Tax=Sinosporangium siamense TaxID=1367973 RepID=A0A919RPP0_9ACTN|nr:hypothetical protein Ssi02_72180 [Sinosporangium siamense]
MAKIIDRSALPYHAHVENTCIIDLIQAVAARPPIKAPGKCDDIFAGSGELIQNRGHDVRTEVSIPPGFHAP